MISQTRLAIRLFRLGFVGLLLAALGLTIYDRTWTLDELRLARAELAATRRLYEASEAKHAASVADRAEIRGQLARALAAIEYGRKDRDRIQAELKRSIDGMDELRGLVRENHAMLKAMGGKP